MSQDFKKILEQEYGWEFEGPFYSEIPESKYQRTCRRDMERLTDFLLNMYIIKDQFDDHDARREFFKSIKSQYPSLSTWVRRHSKVVGNNLLGVVISMSNIIRNKSVDTDHTQSLEELFTPELYSVPGPKYNAMSFEEKVAYVRQLDDAVFKFLKILSTDSE